MRGSRTSGHTLLRVRRATLLALLASTLAACAPIYTGKAETLTPRALTSDPGWTAVHGVPELRQQSELDCGPVALSMVTQYWERTARTAALEESTPVTQRASAAELRDFARARGYGAFLVVGTLNDIEHELQQQRPMIVGMAKPTTSGALGHYEVVVGLHRARQRIATLDPALGLRQYTFESFLREWIGAGRPLLVLLGPPQKQDLPATDSETAVTAR